MPIFSLLLIKKLFSRVLTHQGLISVYFIQYINSEDNENKTKKLIYIHKTILHFIYIVVSQKMNTRNVTTYKNINLMIHEQIVCRKGQKWKKV